MLLIGLEFFTNLQDNGEQKSGYGLFYYPYPDANGMMWWISTQDSVLIIILLFPTFLWT